ncbi:zinc-binding dehydrogenase [Christensenella hongkongensis]|uniref:Sorbitol dehydrogenase n=1 Tax=Christensenella hongkongensis TaxID=270498 RepID=A0A0M2NID8_9FIRM|nr:alcohol dehydrogenase catalytic domain-containing protein [Christensenella hongkongensis]KKI51938.1 Sorbitol dehydrogenase [Christensenella hongkongensis]TCW24535.1 L-iditol 2-dehydrogenase [Christensenella hongkongensis]
MKKVDGIPKIMKALVAYGPNDFRYEDHKVPEITEDEVLIKSLGCGICAGDIKSYHGAAMFWGGNNLPQWQTPGVIGGHEFSGEVVAIGDNAAKKYGLELGDWCAPEQILPCWECRFCEEGMRWMCEKHDMYGFQKGITDGGMADYVRLSSRSIIHKLDKSIGIKGAAFVEPASCAAHTIERAGISMRDVVVIAGMGPIGLAKTRFAKMKSPKLLIALDAKQNRLEAAKKMGADLCINIAEEDAVKKVKDLTDGYGCDIYIECAGYPSSVINGLNMVRKRGKFIEFSVFGQEVTVDWSIIGDRKELDLLGAHISGLEGYEVAISAITKGTLDVETLVTHRVPMQDWKTGFELAEQGDPAIKVVLIPEAMQK